MAVVGTSVVDPTGMLTLAEQLAREDRNGNVAPVIEALNQTNNVLKDEILRTSLERLKRVIRNHIQNTNLEIKQLQRLPQVTKILKLLMLQ